MSMRMRWFLFISCCLAAAFIASCTTAGAATAGGVVGATTPKALAYIQELLASGAITEAQAQKFSALAQLGSDGLQLVMGIVGSIGDALHGTQQTAAATAAQVADLKAQHAGTVADLAAAKAQLAATVQSVQSVGTDLSTAKAALLAGGGAGVAHAANAPARRRSVIHAVKQEVAPATTATAAPAAKAA